MTVRLYEVTSTVIRDGFTRAYVNVFHVAAPSRQRAIKVIRERIYTNGANAVSISARCMGSQVRTETRVLMEKTA